MPYEGTVQQLYQSLTPEKQDTVYQFLLFLASTPTDEAQKVSKTGKKRQLGALSNRFHGIADDFDAPISDFQEYQ